MFSGSDCNIVALTNVPHTRVNHVIFDPYLFHLVKNTRRQVRPQNSSLFMSEPHAVHTFVLLICQRDLATHNQTRMYNA